MARQLSRKKRLAAIGVVGVVLAGGGGAAYAYWTSGGEGEGTATTGTSVAFAVDMDAPAGGDLAPGVGTQTVPFSVTNTSTGAQRLSSVVVTVAEADGTPWAPAGGCSEADYEVSAPTYDDTPAPATMAPSDVITGTVAVTMNETGANQDGCKDIDVPLYILAS